MSELLNRYLSYCRFQKELSAKTIKAYRIDLTQFFIFSAGQQLEKELIEKYLESLHEKYAVRSIRRKLASARAFLNWMEAEDIISENPFDRMNIRIKPPKELPRTISLSTVRRILLEAYRRTQLKSVQKSHSATRDIAVLELLFSSGLRVSELCGLRPRDIDFKARTLRILGKGAKERIVQIGSQETLDALMTYKKSFGKEINRVGFFFVNRFGHRLSEDSVREMLSNYCRRLHITQHITPHMFRHTFATSLHDSGVDIRYIQQILGHSSIKTTEIYTHVSTIAQRRILTAKNPRLRINLPHPSMAG